MQKTKQRHGRIRETGDVRILEERISKTERMELHSVLGMMQEGKERNWRKIA